MKNVGVCEFLICGSKLKQLDVAIIKAIRHGKNMSIYDYFILGECSFNQNYFFHKFMNFHGKCITFLLLAPVGNTDKYSITFAWHKTLLTAI